MATVDCQECSKNFQTFKLYIKHLLTKECKGKQKPEQQLSAEPENKRLKVSPKLFQKKKHEADSTTIAQEQFVISGEPVYVPVSRGSENANIEQTMKKTIMQNMHPHKIASTEKFVVSQDDSGLKITSVTSLGANNRPIPHPIKPANIRPPKTSAPIPQAPPPKPAVPAKPGKAPCSLCSKLVKSRGMTQHVNMQHKCKYCSELVENVDQHISETHEREPCEYCSKKFENSDSLEKHIEISHLEKCEQCEDEFYSEESLRYHVVDVHESELCDICDIKFLIADKMMDEHKDKVHGIKTKTIKQFGGMMFMMVSD
eukprot:GFUD01025681.1.p1 GENE.GFUD01025681.1~~GFUD01025681.1.p1  ORF type:complete len:314 (-),score=66.15 GFUD01025681.1:76-1017(-)